MKKTSLMKERDDAQALYVLDIRLYLKKVDLDYRCNKIITISHLLS